MPPTTDELVQVARARLDGECMPDDPTHWADGTTITTAEEREIRALVQYECRVRAKRRRNAGPAYRRAMQLLRSFLTKEQRRQLESGRRFTVAAASGKRYRFWPGLGRCVQLCQHGQRWYEAWEYCLHPEPNDLPDPDVTLAQLLLLSADEAEFLRRANATAVGYTQLWNGSYQRQMRLARAQRARAEEEEDERAPEA